MLPVISVIIPTYNRARLLVDRCLPSVFAQTVQDMEIHVIGDGTDQETVDAMADEPRVRFTNLPHYAYPSDPRARWATIGLASLNYGLDHARGDWIAVLADDDAWEPEHNAILLDAAEASGADHVYGVSTGPQRTWGAWPPGDGQFCNGANLYRASLPYRYDLQCYMRGLTGDADLWLRMITGGVRFHFVDRVVHRYYPSAWWEWRAS